MSTKHQKSMQAKGKNDSGQEVKLIHQEAYQGPLPHPDLLKKFDEIVPGAAGRILDMAEKEQNHRHQLESKIITNENISIENEMKLKKMGLIFGFILAFLIIILGVFLLFINKSVEGFSLILGTIAMIIAPFCFKNNNNKDK